MLVLEFSKHAKFQVIKETNIWVFFTAREITEVAAGKVEAAYSMMSNPAYQKGSTLTRDSAPGEATPNLASPPVSNPTYVSISASPPNSTARQNSMSSFIRYPRVMFRSRRPSAHPASPPPTTPAPLCPDPPPPPPPYALTTSSRPPPLTLKNPHAAGSPLSPPPPSPPSPYSNPYKSPRPRSPDSIYEPVLPPIIPLSPSSTMTRGSDLPQMMSGSSTMTRGSDQSSGDTRSTSPGSSVASSAANNSDSTHHE